MTLRYKPRTMIKFLAGLIFFIFSSDSFGQKVKHVVLISVDGLRPEFYSDKTWPAPNLQQMAEEGVFAKGVTSVFPSVTYPSHTTIITGALPARHGIYYNSPFEPAGQTGKWYWEESLIKTPTLWDAVKDADLKSASVTWPVTVGAPIDYNIPEIWSLDKNEERFAPTRKLSTPGLLEELEKNATGVLNSKTYNGDYLSVEDKVGSMAAYLLENYKPGLLTVHIIAADHFQHEQGREGPKVRKAVAAVDRAIGHILEAAERAGINDSTAFIITGDHGFVNINTVLSPNLWLVKAGLLEDKANNREWKAAFHTSGASAFLHLKDKNDKKTVSKVKDILAKLPETEKKLFRVVERDELDRIGADPNAALALAPIQGVSMSASTKGEVLKPGKGGTHGFFPDFKEIQTGFIGWGPGFAKGKSVELIALQDISPLVAKLLNLDFTAPDGKLYPEILDIEEGK